MQLPHTLSEKESKFPQYNMKCSGEHDTTWNIPCTFTFPPLHFMLYRGKYIFFGTVCLTYKSVKIWNKLIFEDIIMSATDTFQILLGRNSDPETFFKNLLLCFVGKNSTRFQASTKNSQKSGLSTKIKYKNILQCWLDFVIKN